MEKTSPTVSIFVSQFFSSSTTCLLLSLMVSFHIFIFIVCFSHLSLALFLFVGKFIKNIFILHLISVTAILVLPLCIIFSVC